MKSEQISTRIKQWRKHIGLTQQQFADMAGIQIGVFKKYEQGLNVPGGEALTGIASTGVNINWLLTGQGEMKIASPSSTAYIPEALEDQADRLKAIHGLLAMMEENKRESIIDEIFTRVQEIKRIDELEQMVTELRNQQRTGA